MTHHARGNTPAPAQPDYSSAPSLPSTDDLIDAMSTARAAWIGAELRQWYDDRTLTAGIRASVEQDAAWVGDESFGATFRDNVGSVPVADPLAWANRLLDLGAGEWAVVGPRFRGLDVSQPFVDIVATSLPPTAESMRVLLDAVQEPYAGFAPRRVRVDAPDPDAFVAALSSDGLSATVDQYVVAGLVAELRRAPRVPRYSDVALESIDPAAGAVFLAECYAELALERPELPQWSTPSDADELSECAEQGLLFQTVVDGQRAGLVGARRNDAHAMTGFDVVDIVVATSHRGRGFGPAALQRVCDALPANPGDVLWGTIHPDNAPSRRNAARIGRTVVGGFVWVDLAT